MTNCYVTLLVRIPSTHSVLEGKVKSPQSFWKGPFPRKVEFGLPTQSVRFSFLFLLDVVPWVDTIRVLVLPRPPDLLDFLQVLKSTFFDPNKYDLFLPIFNLLSKVILFHKYVFRTGGRDSERVFFSPSPQGSWLGLSPYPVGFIFPVFRSFVVGVSRSLGESPFRTHPNPPHSGNRHSHSTRVPDENHSLFTNNLTKDFFRQSIDIPKGKRFPTRLTLVWTHEPSLPFLTRRGSPEGRDREGSSRE